MTDEVLIHLNGEKHGKINADDIVTCVSCKHYYRTWHMKWNNEGALCTRKGSTIDLISGKITLPNSHTSEYCVTERKYDCGVEGAYWSPKENTKENTFKLLKRTK